MQQNSTFPVGGGGEVQRLNFLFTVFCSPLISPNQSAPRGYLIRGPPKQNILRGLKDLGPQTKVCLGGESAPEQDSTMIPKTRIFFFQKKDKLALLKRKEVIIGGL